MKPDDRTAHLGCQDESLGFMSLDDFDSLTGWLAIPIDVR
jgi:hypothetical protein